MDKTRRLFDEWARSGRAESMETGHARNVTRFLGSISFGSRFTFLDVGCGNGWTVRMMAEKDGCKRAVGIDKSRMMIIHAKRKAKSKAEGVLPYGHRVVEIQGEV